MKRFLLSLTALWASAALALDVPEGGDGLGHQLRSAKSVVMAQLVDSKQLLFTTSAVIVGQAPSTLQFPADQYLASADLRNGDWYLLFLGVGARGEPILPSSRYSVSPVNPVDLSVVSRAVKDYLATQRQPEAFKKVGLGLARSPVAFLQYSAFTDLARARLFSAADAALLAEVALGKPASVEAQKIALRQLGVVQAKTYAQRLGSVLGDAARPTSVRLAALDGLSFMGATEVIEQQAKSIAASTSPKLKARALEAVGQR